MNRHDFIDQFKLSGHDRATVAAKVTDVDNTVGGPYDGIAYEKILATLDAEHPAAPLAREALNLFGRMSNLVPRDLDGITRLYEYLCVTSAACLETIYAFSERN